MKLDKKINLIKKMLRRKKEVPILELQIKEYNNSNFYITLLYNQNIEKFKVLYIPLDVVEDNKIEEYCCYQFIDVKSVLYILEQIKKEIPKYESDSIRDNRNKNINNFYIEISIYLSKKKYDFYATRYLPKEWKFLFEGIVMLFEHSPNIMGELVNEILSVIMNTNENIEYQASLNCDLSTTNLKSYFPILQDEKKLIDKKIDFLENVNGKYYAIIEEHLIIVEYNNNRKILNIYCDQSNLVYSNEVYQVLMGIKEQQEEKFYKIKVIDKKNNKNFNYLCLGVTDKEIKVIEKNKISKITFKALKDQEIKILEDKNNKLKKKLGKVMTS